MSVSRFAITLVAIVALLGVPATVSAVDVWTSPHLPAPLPEPRAGTTVVQVSVYDGATWATDQTLIHPGPTIDTDCGERLPGEAA